MTDPVRNLPPVQPFQPTAQVRNTPPGGIGAQSTTISPQNLAGKGYLETLLIRFKDFLVWIFQTIFCSKPKASAKAIPATPTPLQANHSAVTPVPIQPMASAVQQDSKEQSLQLLVQFEQLSNLLKIYIYTQIGREIYAKSGSITWGYFQSYGTIGRNAVAHDPQLLKLCLPRQTH